MRLVAPGLRPTNPARGALALLYLAPSEGACIMAKALKRLRVVGRHRVPPVHHAPGNTALGHLYLKRDENEKIMADTAFGVFVRIVQGYLKHLDGKHGGYSLESLRTEKDVIDVISTLTPGTTNRRMSLQLSVLGRRSNKLPQKPPSYWRKIVSDLMPELE